jgi:NADPH:quinone reductase
VVTEIEGDFDIIVEGIGGATLGAAIEHVAPRGTVVSFASTDTAPVSYPARQLFGRAPGARVHGLFVFPEVAQTGAQDLARLAALVAAGRLDGQIEREVSWHEAGDAIRALVDRTITGGKIVLRVD